MGSKDDHLQIATKDRVESFAAAKASAEQIKAAGGLESLLGSQQTVPLETARSIVELWPTAPQKTAAMILDHYGPPNEATPTKLFWYQAGPWTRMELTADEVVHDFPTPHTDYFTQYVKYPVEPDKAGDLLAFDGSTLIDHTTGELGSRCSNEPYNTLTVNLAVELLRGQRKRSIDEARQLYADTCAAYMLGRDAPYAERLLFTPPAGETADPDEPMMAGRMLGQLKEKAKDLFDAGETPQ